MSFSARFGQAVFALRFARCSPRLLFGGGSVGLRGRFVRLRVSGGLFFLRGSVLYCEIVRGLAVGWLALLSGG